MYLKQCITKKTMEYGLHDNKLITTALVAVLYFSKLLDTPQLMQMQNYLPAILQLPTIMGNCSYNRLSDNFIVF